jgi:hypothetical protein
MQQRNLVLPATVTVAAAESYVAAARLGLAGSRICQASGGFDRDGMMDPSR